MKKEKVSVALTTYNGASFLRQQLDSIFQQSYKSLEIVAVDDCSTDGTVEILKKYSKRFPLRYIANKKRLGFIKNFEHAISLCGGDFIALADQDDVWKPEKLEILISQIGDRSVACSDFSLIDDKGFLIAPSFRRDLNVPIPDFAKQFYSLVFINFVQGCTCLFRKNFKEYILPIPIEAMSHDWWIGIVATQRNGIAYVDSPLVMYRQHRKNTLGAKEMWKFSGKLSYIFSSARKEIMKNELDRIKYYIDHGIFSNNEQRKILDVLCTHYDSIVNSRIHFRTFVIVFKHRHLLLPNISPISRWIYLLGRLV
jgi:glycosyltransferase involved in cell wall biosynthesis